MSTRETNDREKHAERSARMIALVSVATLIAAALASAWRLLAAQSPSSPLHLGPLVGPVESLATVSWIAGFGGLAIAALLGARILDPTMARRASALLAAGWLILFAGLVAGAVLGTFGTQIIKAYPRTVAVLLTKSLGFLLIMGGLVALMMACVRRRGGR